MSDDGGNHGGIGNVARMPSNLGDTEEDTTTDADDASPYSSSHLKIKEDVSIQADRRLSSSSLEDEKPPSSRSTNEPEFMQAAADIKEEDLSASFRASWKSEMKEPPPSDQERKSSVSEHRRFSKDSQTTENRSSLREEDSGELTRLVSNKEPIRLCHSSEEGDTREAVVIVEEGKRRSRGNSLNEKATPLRGRNSNEGLPIVAATYIADEYVSHEGAAPMFYVDGEVTTPEQTLVSTNPGDDPHGSTQEAYAVLASQPLSMPPPPPSGEIQRETTDQSHPASLQTITFDEEAFTMAQSTLTEPDPEQKVLRPGQVACSRRRLIIISIIVALFLIGIIIGTTLGLTNRSSKEEDSRKQVDTMMDTPAPTFSPTCSGMWEMTSSFNVSSKWKTENIVLSRDCSTVFFYEVVDGDTSYSMYGDLDVTEGDDFGQHNYPFESGMSGATVTAAAMSGEAQHLFIGQTFEATSTSDLYAYSRDEGIVSGSVWNLKVKGPRFDLRGDEPYEIVDVASSWNGSYVAFAASDGTNGTVRVIGVEEDGTITERGELKRGDFDQSVRVDLSADGLRLFVCVRNEIQVYQYNKSPETGTPQWNKMGETVTDSKGGRQLQIEAFKNGNLFSFGAFDTKEKWELVRWFQDSEWDSVVTTSRNEITVSGNGNVLALLGFAERGVVDPNAISSVSLYGLPSEIVPITELQRFNFPPGPYVRTRLSMDGSRMVAIVSGKILVYERICSVGEGS